MPTREHKAEVTINAAPDAVWQVLTDGATWPEWDPTCERIEGTIAPGAKIKAFTKLSPGRAFPVKVASFDAGKSMMWSGGMPLGLFKGERTFTLAPAGEGKTTYTLREVFSGPMLALIGKTIPDMDGPFKQHAEGLKKRVEGGK